jgi:nucleosome binding factor SPN SPT16 subunit
MWDQPTFDLYRKAFCPITLIVADQEPMNEALKEFANMRKQGIAHIQEVRSDVRIVIMQNTMHDIPLQRPKELAEIIVKVGAIS